MGKMRGWPYRLLLKRTTVGLLSAKFEIVRFVYLDAAGDVLGERESSSNDPSRVDLPIRDVARDVIRLDARAVFMAHNHPSGDPTPSNGDLIATRRLWTILDAIDVLLLDHVVLAHSGWFSLRQRGLL